MVMPIIILLVIILNKQIKQNNDYNKDTKALKFWKYKIERKIYLPIKNWILNFIQFLNEHSIYIKLWIAIWFYSFIGYKRK